MAYHRYHGLDTRIVRIFNTYGTRMRPNDGRVISNFVVQAIKGEPLAVYGDGKQTRSFCYVSDLVDGIVRLLYHTDTGPSKNSEDFNNEGASPDNPLPVNIGNPGEFTVLELAEMVLRLTRSNSVIERKPLPVDDPRVRRPDISRAQSILEWQPR